MLLLPRHAGHQDVSEPLYLRCVEDALHVGHEVQVRSLLSSPAHQDMHIAGSIDRFRGFVMDRHPQCHPRSACRHTKGGNAIICLSIVLLYTNDARCRDRATGGERMQMQVSNSSGQAYLHEGTHGAVSCHSTGGLAYTGVCRGHPTHWTREKRVLTAAHLLLPSPAQYRTSTSLLRLPRLERKI